MLDGPIVFRDPTDTYRGETRFRAQFGHDLFDGAEPAWLDQVASLERPNERYASC